MRRAGWWTETRYQLRRLADRLAWCWAWVLAGVEEITILLGLRPRYIPPPRHGLHVPGHTPWQAARRAAVDPRFVPPAESTKERRP